MARHPHAVQLRHRAQVVAAGAGSAQLGNKAGSEVDGDAARIGRPTYDTRAGVVQGRCAHQAMR
jgi:hypothetical protein